MPRYRIEPLEKFVARAVYHVEADFELQAEALCRRGDVAYEHSSIEEGGEEWLESALVEEITG